MSLAFISGNGKEVHVRKGEARWGLFGEMVNGFEWNSGFQGRQ